MLKEKTRKTAELLDLLSDEDFLLVEIIIKKLILAWDPDFTKVAPKEKVLLDKSDEEMKKGKYFSEDDL